MTEDNDRCTLSLSEREELTLLTLNPKVGHIKDINSPITYLLFAKANMENPMASQKQKRPLLRPFNSTLSLLIKSFNSAFDCHHQRLTTTVKRFVRWDFYPTFTDAVLFNIKALFAVHFNTDIELKNRLNMVRIFALFVGQG